MLKFVYLLSWFLDRRARKRAEAVERRRDWIMHPLRFGEEMELDPDDEARVMNAVEASVREHVSDPETAEVTDYAFYGPTESGVAVFVEMESTNVVGERARNRFVLLMRRDASVEGCLILDHDPRDERGDATVGDGRSVEEGLAGDK